MFMDVAYLNFQATLCLYLLSLSWKAITRWWKIHKIVLTNHLINHPLIHPFSHSPSHSLIHPFSHSSVHPFTNPSIYHPFTKPIHLSIHSPTHSSIYPFTIHHSFHSLTHSLTHSFIHSFLSPSIVFVWPSAEHRHTWNFFTTFLHPEIRSPVELNKRTT